MPQYKNDPRVTYSKFNSNCAKCGKTIRKGEEIVYWPAKKEAMHHACGQPDLQSFHESAQDEDNYNAQFPGRSY
jgi:hypothetical protein